MKNWIVIVKKVRNIIHQNPNSTLCQAKYITDFIIKNFTPKRKTRVFKDIAQRRMG